MPMSKRRKILLMLAKGSVSQSEMAAALRANRCDVSACARAIRERGLTFDAVAAMSDAEVDAMVCLVKSCFRKSARLSFGFRGVVFLDRCTLGVFGVLFTVGFAACWHNPHVPLTAGGRMGMRRASSMMAALAWRART